MKALLKDAVPFLLLLFFLDSDKLERVLRTEPQKMVEPICEIEEVDEPRPTAKIEKRKAEPKPIAKVEEKKRVEPRPVAFVPSFPPPKPMLLRTKASLVVEKRPAKKAVVAKPFKKRIWPAVERYNSGSYGVKFARN